MNEATEAPGWFVAAMKNPPEHDDLDIDGTRIHVRVWGSRGSPGLVLIHGGAAHSGWWDHVAPFFAATHRVLVPDLSGHGDSARRAEYDMSTWATEIVGAIDALDIGPAIVVGHSMGGRIGVTLTAEHPDTVAGLVIVDSPLNDLPPDEVRLEQRRRPTRVYPTREAAYARFVTLPPQEVILPYVRENVVAQSLREVLGGWTWKFDPALFGNAKTIRALLEQVTCPAIYLRCEHGIVSLATTRQIAESCAVDMPIVELPASGHHPMLDQPLPLVAAIRAAIARW